MPGIGFVGQNLCLAYILLNKTSVPGIRYVGKKHMWELVVKICKTRCFLSEKIISEIK